MIENKRFEFRVCTDELYYFYIIDNETGKEYKYLVDDELLKLLNDLHDEKEELKSLKKKRFTYMEQFNGFCDVYDDGKVLSCMRLEYVEKTVKLLNELNEENKELKKELEGYKKLVGKLFWCEND